MKNDLRFVTPKHVIEPDDMLHFGDHAVVGNVGPVAVEFALERVDAVFAAPEQDQLFGSETADLPHQFRTDRPARAGNHHHLIGDVVAYGGGVEFDGGAAEQVFDLYLADTADPNLTAQQLVNARHDAVL